MGQRTTILPIHCVFLIWASLVGSASGVVLHTGSGEPWDRPNNAVLVRWSNNASAVAIGPSWLLTTRHQNTSPATVSIDGTTYYCVYHENWNGGQTGNADIRLVKLLDDTGEDAQLIHYANVYAGIGEVGEYFVVGGYGKGRGAELRTSGTLYGYEWENSSNTILRWGGNKVIGFATGGGQYTSDVITADFDGSGEGDSTPYEGAVAEYDSGGGWFIKTDSIWKVAGLSRGVEHGLEGESWFRNKDKPWQLDPDYMDAVRVSSYANWIAQKTAQPFCALAIPGDTNSDCKINMFDLADFLAQWLRNDCEDISNCEGADVEPDGDVDLVDFAILTRNWLECRLEPIEACDY